MNCKDCGRKIRKLHKGERICNRCSIGYDMLNSTKNNKSEHLTVNDIDLQREQAQQDILCILDGIDDQDILDNVCQVIVDRFNILKSKLTADLKGRTNEIL